MGFFKFKKKTTFGGRNQNAFKQNNENKFAEKKEKLFEAEKNDGESMLDEDTRKHEEMMKAEEAKYK